MTPADRAVPPQADPFPLKNRTVVITGSTRGIGRIMAEAIVMAGANLVVTARTEAAIEVTVAELRSLAEGPIQGQTQEPIQEQNPAQVWGQVCDVSQLEQVEALAQATIDRFGQLDVWFNNAAVTHAFGPVLDIPYSQWRQVIDTNIVGTYHGTIAALKQMLPREKGVIINFLGAGTSGDVANGYLSAYTASKAAIQRFTQVAADDYKQSGIKICGLNPGLMPTDLTVKIEPVNEEAQRRLKFLRFGLRWFATPPENIAKMALKLATDGPQVKNGGFYRCLPDLRLNLQRGIQGSHLPTPSQPQ